MEQVEQLIVLIKSAINGEKIDVPTENVEALFEAAERHMVSALSGYAFENAGIKNQYASEAIGKAIQKSILLNKEIQSIYGALEEAKIWYAPLKGIVIKNYYPKQEMREMSDVDILFDATRAEDVKRIMENMGFSAISFDEEHHDIYIKKPFANIEMHRTLFQERNTMYEYYEDVKSRLVLDEGSQYRYHFSPEDFYVYVVAHEYLHFAFYPGTGIRALTDIYFLLKRFEKTLDWDYVEKECAKLEILEFEEKNRKLAMHLWGDGKLTKSDKEFLQYFMTQGVYGSTKDGVKYKVDALGGGKKGKLKYVIRRLFPPMRWIKQRMPFIYRHKSLLFAVPFIRLWQAVTSKREVAVNELTQVIKKE